MGGILSQDFREFIGKRGGVIRNVMCWKGNKAVTCLCGVVGPEFKGSVRKGKLGVTRGCTAVVRKSDRSKQHQRREEDILRQGGLKSYIGRSKGITIPDRLTLKYMTPR